MVKEIIDGSTVYSGLYTDVMGNTWNLLIRQGGSVSLYATQHGVGTHYVVYDSLDDLQPNYTARSIISRLSDTAEGINALLCVAQPSDKAT
jgi:hypothetical protein